MAKVVIMGSGAAPGVPALAFGFGACNPDNPKNIRMRAGTYMELSGVKFLIDTSPDLRTQLLAHDIRSLDAVFYTHVHADHLHGIDDLREINRISGKAVELFASENNLRSIRERFSYLIADDTANINPVYRAALHPNSFTYNENFFVGKLKVTPILLDGHNVEVSGYIFNDGEVVHIADFRRIPDEALSLIKKTPELLIMPLTTPQGTVFHAGLDDLIYYQKRIGAKRVLINHMAAECDYDAVKAQCPEAMVPAFDGMRVEF